MFFLIEVTKYLHTFTTLQQVDNESIPREGTFTSLHTIWRHDDVKVREGAFTRKHFVINTLQECEGVKALLIFLYGNLFTAYLPCREQGNHYTHTELAELTEIEGEGL